MDEKVKYKRRTMPPKPRFSKERLEEEIRELEYKHQTTSMSNMQERNMLKEISELKSQRRLFRGYEDATSEISRLGRLRDMAREKVGTLRKSERELGKGLRKVEVTRKIFSLTNEQVHQVCAFRIDKPCFCRRLTGHVFTPQRTHSTQLTHITHKIQHTDFTVRGSRRAGFGQTVLHGGLGRSQRVECVQARG